MSAASQFRDKMLPAKRVLLMSQSAQSLAPSLQSLGLGDNGGFALRHAVMPDDEAQEIVKDQWNIAGAATRLPSEKDDTFRIITNDGEKFILKVSHPAEDVCEIDLELSAMRHVEWCDPALPVTRVISSHDGAYLVDLHDRAGTSRKARLLSYIEGTVLDSTDASCCEREKVGEMLARLRLALANFRHVAEKRPYIWNVENLAALAPLQDHVSDRDQRRLLSRGLERFFEVVHPRMAGLRHQIVHNDFSRSNIIVDHRRPQFVVGVIDFGDVVNTAIAIDVSTAILNQLPRHIRAPATEDIFRDGHDLLRGYLKVADLTHEELSLIPHLVMGRIIARALITSCRAKFVPDNAAYILRNTEQGWNQLRWFLDRSTDEISNLLF